MMISSTLLFTVVCQSKTWVGAFVCQSMGRVFEPLYDQKNKSVNKPSKNISSQLHAVMSNTK